MSNIAKEKQGETVTLGSYNCNLELDGRTFEVLTVEAPSTAAAFAKIVGMYPLLRSKYLDDQIGYDDANLLVESLRDQVYDVEYDSENEPLVLGKHQVSIPLKDETIKKLTGTFYKRIII